MQFGGGCDAAARGCPQAGYRAGWPRDGMDCPPLDTAEGAKTLAQVVAARRRLDQPRAVASFSRRSVHSIRDYQYKICYAAPSDSAPPTATRPGWTSSTAAAWPSPNPGSGPSPAGPPAPRAISDYHRSEAASKTNRTQLPISHWFYLFSAPRHWGDNRILHVPADPPTHARTRTRTRSQHRLSETLDPRRFRFGSARIG